MTNEELITVIQNGDPDTPPPLRSIPRIGD